MSTGRTLSVEHRTKSISICLPRVRGNSQRNTTHLQLPKLHTSCIGATVTESGLMTTPSTQSSSACLKRWRLRPDPVVKAKNEAGVVALTGECAKTSSWT